MKKPMRIAALFVALFAITIGAVGLFAPDTLTRVRREAVDTPGAVHVTGALRVAMGLVLIGVASKSRTPKILRVVGVVMAFQGIVPQFMEPERIRMILRQEELMGVTALRGGALIALATGCFIAFTVSPRPRVH
jgi:hypothetical protein